MKPSTPEERVLADLAIAILSIFWAVMCFVVVALSIGHLLPVSESICEELALTNQVPDMAQYVEECNEQMSTVGILMLGLGSMLFATAFGVLGARSNFLELTQKYSGLEELERKDNDDRLVD